MGRIIASTYEIEREIGSGGGGVVYLGKHLRLNKQIVLKAYTRNASTKPAVLSREVDALKNLSHTYIPQVYDYVEENGTVYSVMEYIEGESLDKPLKRGERFPQPQIIQWAYHLLDALIYLHSRPPYGILHSDIKPANIMLTPQGDIRLIDFNIALALGEEGAVRVGFSRGYASPEHYGISYASPALADLGKTRLNAATELNVETQLPTSPETQLSRGSSTTGGSVMLDVRSDIYSLGATLYHLLTGRRPASSAMEVVPILSREASPAVAAIIQKAMAPDPAERYQSAEEMLRAFRQLRQDDPRTKRHRRRVAQTMSILIILFLAGGFSTFFGLRQMEQLQARERAAAEMAERTLALITESESACRRGDIPAAVSASAEALQADGSPYKASAQLALTEALGVYQLSDGFRSSRTLQVPDTLIKPVLSPRGTRAALVTLGQVRVFDTERGEELASLPLERSALSDVIFSGEERLFYAGENGAAAYDLQSRQVLWTGMPATGLALSQNGRTLAAVYKDDAGAVLYNAASGEMVRSVSFGTQHQDSAVNDLYADPESDIFSLSGSGRFLAVSFSDGGLTVFDTQDSGSSLSVFESSEYTYFEGGFYGNCLAFSASNATESIFAVVDAERQIQTIGLSASDVFHVRADGSGICLSLGNTLVQIDPESGEQTELAYTSENIAAYRRDSEHTLVLRESGALTFFDSGAREIETLDAGRCDFICLGGGYALAASRDSSLVRVLRLEEHSDARLRRYDEAYPHSEARIGNDGTLMLFSYEGFQLYAQDGTLLLEENFPDAGQIYDQQYLREEGALEVTYYDGTVRRYAASNGVLSSERQAASPDKSLNEEFRTSRLRIAAPLHGRAAIYDLESGKVIREMETEDSVTYVTETGNYVIVEYITAQGERYGLLLNEACETLARLPGLCDILPDGTLVFDYMRGNLRQSRIYSTRELLALGESYEGGNKA